MGWFRVRVRVKVGWLREFRVKINSAVVIDEARQKQRQDKTRRMEIEMRTAMTKTMTVATVMTRRV
jgi:hypothetical protein